VHSVMSQTLPVTGNFRFLPNSQTLSLNVGAASTIPLWLFATLIVCFGPSIHRHLLKTCSSTDRIRSRVPSQPRYDGFADVRAKSHSRLIKRKLGQYPHRENVTHSGMTRGFCIRAFQDDSLEFGPRCRQKGVKGRLAIM